MRSYETARNIFGLIEFASWVCVAAGVIAALGGASASSSFGSNGAGALLAAVPGIVLIVTGLVGAALCQMGRANVDTAEMTGQILKVARDQLEVSRQASLGIADKAKLSDRAKARAKPTLNKTSSEKAEPVKRSGVKKLINGKSTMIEYLGKQIELKGDKYFYRGISFATEEKALEYVENFAAGG